MEDVIELETLVAYHIDAVCEEAVALANKEQKPVHFEFNETHVTVQPGENAVVVAERWRTDFDLAAEAYRNDPRTLLGALEREKRELIEREALMVDVSSGESEMRDAKVPWPKTEKQLAEYIASLVNREHNYGTCVYAMSMAATATFNFVAGQLGVTGFQAGCADLDVVRRARRIKGPFMILQAEDALYPQRDVMGRVAEAMAKWKPWLAEQAKAMLQEGGPAHPDVVAHWKMLAGKVDG